MTVPQYISSLTHLSRVYEQSVKCTNRRLDPEQEFHTIHKLNECHVSRQTALLFPDSLQRLPQSAQCITAINATYWLAATVPAQHFEPRQRESKNMMSLSLLQMIISTATLIADVSPLTASFDS